MGHTAGAPAGAHRMPARPVYLESQVIARETQPVFALDLPAKRLGELRRAGLSAGDTLSVVDAVQDFFNCRVVSFDDALRVRIAAREQDRAVSSVYLVQGLCEDEVMDTIIRQATEIGVAGFAPFTSAFSTHPDPARRAESLEHWASLSRYAALQAGFSLLPSVGAVRDIPQTCDLLGRFDAVVLCWEGETQRTMADAVSQLKGWGLDRDADIALVVGPRGGITDREMAQLGSANDRLLTVTLGRAILRVETASLVAPTLLIGGLGGLQ
jgi:16S rRNA (uracil1498-N3)-methyltransferase